MSTLKRTNYFVHFFGGFGRLRAYASPAPLALCFLGVCVACAGGTQAPPPTYAAAPPYVESSSLTAANDDALSPASHASGTSPPAGLPGQSATTPVDDEAANDDVVDDESAEIELGREGADTGGSAFAVRTPHPLATRTPSQLQKAVREDPQSLGPMSVGAPNGGALFNAVQLPDDPRWERVDAAHAWGTQETVDNLARAIDKVHDQFPDSLRLPIGHLSGRFGGHINPHRSHQAGTDVDVGFYYKPAAHRWYVRGTRETLDLPRTWALVRAFITETDVRFILIDHSIQALLREYATSIGEDEDWLNDVFKGQGHARPPLIRHAKGHATHLHVRFYSPLAEETGRRCYPALLSAGRIKPATQFVSYKAKKGDTLLSLAKRFGTTVKAIKRVNGLRSNTILAKRSYKIPSTGHTVHQARQVDIPIRRLPPSVKNPAAPGATAPSTTIVGQIGEMPPSDGQGCESDKAGADCE